MSFSAILRRSVSRVAPLAIQFTGIQRTPAAAAPTPRVIAAAASRFYSAAPSAVDDGASSDKKLIEIFQNEIDEVDPIEKTVDVPGDFPFSIEDKIGDQTVTLTREYDGEKITVEVSMPSRDEDEGEDEDNEDSHTELSVPLLVTVVKQNAPNGPYLEFDCNAFPDEIRINNLLLKNLDTEDQLAYEGPDFFDLDENLQKGFHKYLEIRGVKPSTTNFLHEYMIEKDNREYLRWLKDVKSFVEA